jgi:hypothetical protein
MDMLARHGITMHEFATLQEKLLIMKNREHDWHEYIFWTEETGRTFTIHTSNGGTMERSWNRTRNSFALRDQRRNEYYKSATWAYIHNIVLEAYEYQCAGCGGVATQTHHDGHNEKHGNYTHLGRGNKQEINCLVPVCHRCHMVITNIQNKKKWRTKLKVEKSEKSKSASIFSEEF